LRPDFSIQGIDHRKVELVFEEIFLEQDILKALDWRTFHLTPYDFGLALLVSFQSRIDEEILEKFNNLMIISMLGRFFLL
jgi:hypothetical protein